MLSNITTITTYAKRARAKAGALLDEHSHITYAGRVGIALAIGLTGLATVFAFTGSQSLGGLRTTLIAAVAGASAVEETPIVLSGVSVQGEVMPSRELALSSRASGVIASAPRVGDYVSEGDVVMRIEDTAALRAVRSAEVALASARLAADMNRRASVLALSSDASARSDASSELDRALATGWDEVGDILPLLPDVITGLSGILYGGGGFGDDENSLVRHAGIIEADNEAISPLIARAADGYVEAKKSYESAYNLFHDQSNPNNTERETMIREANDTLRTLSSALDAADQLFSFIQNHRQSFGYQMPLVFESYDESLSNYQEQASNQLSILDGTLALVEAAYAVMNGETPVPASPESAELAIRAAQLALDEARARLAAHELRAPFSGTIARVDKRAAQYVGDGENVILLVASTNTVRVYLAQGEAARVNVGTRVMVSLQDTDIAVPGVVEEMEPKGEKNEDGDIVFGAVITFPKPDERLKPGMEVRVGFEMESTDPRS